MPANGDPMIKPIPVILDTDIGDDIDDTWALAMMLQCPEIEVKMVLSATEDTTYRAKIIAKYLESVGCGHIPVGVGAIGKPGGARQRQAAWVRNYDLKDYPGGVSEDGVGAAAQILLTAPEPVTLISIAPLGNVAEMIRRHMDLPQSTHFVGMQGALDIGYGGQGPVSAEWNVKVDPTSAQVVFGSPWKSCTITPLDTCGSVRLDGDAYQMVRHSTNVFCKHLMENYDIWADFSGEPGAAEKSTVLYDTVAIHLSYSQEFLDYETVGIQVNPEGLTIRDPKGPPVRVATGWKNLPAFKQNLIRRLTGLSATWSIGTEFAGDAE